MTLTERAGLAATVADYLAELLGRPLPLRLRAWDGSEAGPDGGPTVTLRSAAALRYILWAPGELGVARAYVTGELAVDGDVEAGLRLMHSSLRPTGGAGRPPPLRLTPGRAARGLGILMKLGAVGPPPPVPRSEARVAGRLHSTGRDARVISHHYDLSNDFYRLLMDGSMAYSCAYWTSDRPGYTLADAQRDKLDLIGRKLGLGPGVRLLDVGCGWGSLAVHAARHFGASVTAVTVSGEQAAFVGRRVEEEGVADLVELRRADYRDVLADLAGNGRYDAVAAIEMGEHVGEGNYPDFLSGVRRSLGDGGRFLLQVMSRPGRRPGGGPFIERYIAPDMTMRPLPATLAHLEAAGFEIRDVQALREHYARTIRAWRAVFERRIDEVVSLIGAERARVWRLYLAGGALAFEQNRMGVDQVLAGRPTPDGVSAMPASRGGWEPGGTPPPVARPAVERPVAT